MMARHDVPGLDKVDREDARRGLVEQREQSGLHDLRVAADELLLAVVEMAIEVAGRLMAVGAAHLTQLAVAGADPPHVP